MFWLRLRRAAPYRAVSQICNLRRIATNQRLGPVRHSAEHNSAIRQIENLSYKARCRAKQIRSEARGEGAPIQLAIKN
jgi:hypothetical protein